MTNNPQPVVGTASPITAQSTAGPALITDGPSITKTLQKIRRIPKAALEKVRTQAEDLAERVVTTYDADVAHGEVGQGGTAVAAEDDSSDLGPTGLLYGRIQSGKTLAMITFGALAIDNGFRVIVVLTTNFVELVKQTKTRFNDIGRAIVTASTENAEWANPSRVEYMRKKAGERGLVIVCAKHKGHLDSVVKLLEAVGGADYPAIVLDDEADQASLDNNERKRSRSQNPSEVDPTSVSQGILNLRQHLRHHVFLQVTATPYALLLQRVDSPMRPRFTFLLEPGSAYTGGSAFFSDSAVESEQPPLVFVDEQESDSIQDDIEEAPRGLEDAIAFYLVSAAAQMINDPDAMDLSQNFLCHTSHKRSEHSKLEELIYRFLDRFEDELDPLRGRSKALVEYAYDELCKTLEDAPPLDEIVEDIVDRLPNRQIRVVNSEKGTSEEASGVPNFVIGGNIVGRGLTISNLLVTYYLRRPQISQMDTMLQHARMYGYRQELMPYTRVFLPRSLAERFQGIHQSEEELRRTLPTLEAFESAPVQVANELRPTRYGCLHTGCLSVISSGKHLYPNGPSRSLARAAQGEVDRITSDWSAGSPCASIEEVETVLRHLAPPEWNVDDLMTVLRSFSGAEDGSLRRAQEDEPQDRETRYRGDLGQGARRRARSGPPDDLRLGAIDRPARLERGCALLPDHRVPKQHAPHRVRHEHRTGLSHASSRTRLPARRRAVHFAGAHDVRSVSFRRPRRSTGARSGEGAERLRSDPHDLVRQPAAAPIADAPNSLGERPRHLRPRCRGRDRLGKSRPRPRSLPWPPRLASQREVPDLQALARGGLGERRTAGRVGSPACWRCYGRSSGCSGSSTS
jgi:hypothetical protein